MTRTSFGPSLGLLICCILVGGCKPTGTSSRAREVAASAYIDEGAPSSSSHQGAASASGNLSVEMPTTQHDGGSYESIPLSDNIKPLLDIASFEAHVQGLADTSGGDCALGVREGLEKLFGNPIGGQGDAWQYNKDVLDKFASKKGLYYADVDRNSTPPFQDFDVQVLQPTEGGSEFGHVEVFYKGRWYSDFKQDMSLADSSRQNYSTIQVFRLSGGLGVAMFIRREMLTLINWLIPSASADSKKSKSKAPVRRKTLAEISDKTLKSWRVVESWNGEIPTYLLYRQAKTTELVATNSEGFFLLLNAAPDASPVESLADDFLKRRSEQHGRATLQAEILDTKGLLEIQRDAYVRAGYELPKKYNLILIDKN